MARKWFHLVDEGGSPVTNVTAAYVDIENADAFRDAVKTKFGDSFLAGIASSELIVFADHEAYVQHQKLPDPSSSLIALGRAGDNPLIVQVPVRRRVDMDDQHPYKKARSLLRDISSEIPSISLNLDINTWTVGGIDLNIYKVEPDFPRWFYVREETLNIVALFKAQLGVGRHVVCLGTRGVGKSMLVVVYAFFMALIERKRVVLFRKMMAEGYSMLYLDVENNRYWRKDKAAIRDIADLENREFELCLDGFTHKDVSDHFGTLERFRLLATSAPYPTKNDDLPVLRKCLVPFWSLSDLNKVGEYHQWSHQEIKDRYFYSGGNLSDFLSETEVAQDAITMAVRSIGPASANLFKTQYDVTSDRHVVRLRMMGIRENDHQDVGKYMFCEYWVCVITSEYALRQLIKIVEPSYYEELWHQAKQLRDNGLNQVLKVHALL